MLVEGHWFFLFVFFSIFPFPVCPPLLDPAFLTAKEADADLPYSPVRVTWADVHAGRGSTHGHLGGWRSRHCPRGEHSFDPQIHLTPNRPWLCVNVLLWSQKRLFHPSLMASHDKEVHEGPVPISAQMKGYFGRAEVPFTSTVLSQ